jgi:hypothetical protein
MDWKVVDSVFEPLHAQFDFTLEGCADDEGLNSHSDLPHCSPSDSILERDFLGERVFINPPWELAYQIRQHFESDRRTAPTSTMAVFVLPKWAKFNQLTKHWKLYQEFPARTQLFTRQSLENPTQQQVVALAPWHVQLWLVDADCAFTIRLRLHNLTTPYRYLYLLSTRTSPSLRYNNFLRQLQPY